MTIACEADRPGADVHVDSAATVGPGAMPSCGQIEQFAERLSDSGIDYDRDPSFSPTDLARRSDAVIIGTLTGKLVSAEGEPLGDDGYRNSYVSYELAVDEVVGNSRRVDFGQVVNVFVGYSPDSRRTPDYFRDGTDRSDHPVLRCGGAAAHPTFSIDAMDSAAVAWETQAERGEDGIRQSLVPQGSRMAPGAGAAAVRSDGHHVVARPRPGERSSG